MTNQELKEMFARSGARQQDFVSWANARGSRIKKCDVSTHIRGVEGRGISTRNAELYRQFFAEKAEGDFKAAMELALKKVLASGGKRIILDAPPHTFDLLNEVVNAFGHSDFDAYKVVEILNSAIEAAKATGEQYGSLLVVANALPSIADLAKKIY